MERHNASKGPEKSCNKKLTLLNPEFSKSMNMEHFGVSVYLYLEPMGFTCLHF